MKCKYCKTVDMTPQEEAMSPQFCYFCRVKQLKDMDNLMDTKNQIPKPDEFGRTEIELANYLQAITTQSRQKSNFKLQNNPTPETLNTVLNTDQLADHDVQEIEYIRNEDLGVKLWIPGPITEKMHNIIYVNLKTLLDQVVAQRMHGTIFEQYLRDPDEPTNNPNQSFM